MQDIVVVVAMVVLSTLGVGAAENGPAGGVPQVLGAMAAMIVLLALFVRFAATPLMARFARTPELMVIFAIGWAAAAATVGDLVGFGKELGGLAAGVSLGSTPYREMISARLAALRDFLLLFFFLAIGATLDLSTLGQDIGNAAVFSVFVLIGNPLIVVVIMALMGYRARTGFLAGLTVAQISEFSLIFMAMGLALGHVDAAAVGLVTLVGMVTIATSVYMITYSDILYRWARPLLAPLDFARAAAEEDGVGTARTDVILFGIGRFGRPLLQRLDAAGLSVLAVDLDPRAVREWAAKGYNVRFGDVTEPEFWAELPLAQARWIVLALPFGTIQLTETDPRSGLLAAIREHRFQGRVVVTARSDHEEGLLAETGVDLMINPFDAAAAATVARILDLDDAGARPVPAGPA